MTDMDDLLARLLAEFMEAIARGEKPDVDALCARAGDKSDELRKLIALYSHLENVREGADSQSDVDQGPLLNKLGKYEQLEPIGEGGLARIYLARDSELERRVALKVLSPHAVDAMKAKTWIYKEGRTLARLTHPGIVRVYEVGEEDGRAFMAMELLRGVDLRDVLWQLRQDAGLADNGATPAQSEHLAVGADTLRALPDRCRAIARVAEALQACHDAGVIHRDMKPHNVRLVEGVDVRIIDFGLAHLESAQSIEQTTRLYGSAPYVSPEQVAAGETGASVRSDVYSLGVMLYELVTLRNPFQAETRDQTLLNISQSRPKAPREIDESIPADLERVILHAIERDPDERYERPAELAADLTAFVEHRAITLRPPTVTKLARLWMRRNRRRVVLGSLIAGAVLALWFSSALADLARRRGRILDDLGAVSASIEGLHSVGGFNAAYGNLQLLREQAADFERSWLGSLAFAALSPDVDATALACSTRLADTLEPEIAKIETSTDAQAVSARLRALILNWRPTLMVDRQINAHCEINTFNRERGLVDLVFPPGTTDVRLYHREADMLLPMDRLVPVRVIDSPVDGRLPALEEERLDAGGYRVTWRVPPPGLPGEADFSVRPEEPRRELFLVNRQTLTGFDFVAFGARSVPFLLSVEETAAVEVEPYRLSRTPVTWRQLRDTLPDATAAQIALHAISNDHVPPAERIALADDDPAVVFGRLAHTYASALGARLPTTLELRAAMMATELDRPPHEARFEGEWTSTFANWPQDGRYTLAYDGLGQGVPWNVWFGQRSEDTHQTDFVFRLALSDH